jgi:hypothetical protein
MKVGWAQLPFTQNWHHGAGLSLPAKSGISCKASHETGRKRASGAGQLARARDGAVGPRAPKTRSSSAAVTGIE